MDNTEDHSRDEHFIQKLTQIVLDNFTNEQFGVKELVKAYGISRSQLHRKLRTLKGRSVSQFIREIRLDEALKLLQKDVASVSEIAYRVGFSSPTYFNTCFHERYGYSPGEAKFRNQIHDEITAEKTVSETSFRKTQKRKKSKRRIIIILGLAAVLLFSIGYVFYPRSEEVIAVGSNESINIEKSTRKEKSIAVIPFENWSGDPDLQRVPDALTYAVTSKLEKISSLTRVIPYRSMLKYRESDKSITEIAKEQGVNNILEGIFQLSGNRAMINVKLFDVSSNDPPLSYEYTYEYDSNEIFDVQAKVVENVAKNMNVKISDIEIESVRKISTTNKEALRFFIQAEHQRFKSNKTGLSNSIPLYEKAIALDSNFIEAYRCLAMAWMTAGGVWGIIGEQEAWKNSKNLLTKAFEIDSTNLNVHSTLVFGSWIYEWDFDTMEKYYQINLDQGRDDLWGYAIKTGRFNVALSQLDRVILGSPEHGWLYTIKAEALLLLGRKNEAFELLARYDPFYDDDMNYLRETAKLFYYLGDYEKSKNQLNRIMTLFEERSPIILWLNVIHYELEGNDLEVKKYLGELNQFYIEESSGSPAWFIALYYCHIKDYDTAFIWLQKSYDRHEAEMTWFREEPLLIPLRNDLRYKELYEKVGFSKLDKTLFK